MRIRAADAERRARLARALIDAGAGGVQEERDAITTIMPAASDLSAVRNLADPGDVDVTSLGEVDWSARFAPAVGVQRIGHLTIAPPWRADEIADLRHAVLIEPAMAFGTGEHATTRSVLRLMHGVIREGDLVADLGAGSAVLAIAAIRLGAARAAAIESDLDAIGNAESNVALNEVADRVTVLHGEAAALLPLVAPVRVILANILAPVLLELSIVMRASLAEGGRAILSGMLSSERDTMRHALEADGWRMLDEDVDGEWWSTVLATS